MDEIRQKLAKLIGRAVARRWLQQLAIPPTDTDIVGPATQTGPRAGRRPEDVTSPNERPTRPRNKNPRPPEAD